MTEQHTPGPWQAEGDEGRFRLGKARFEASVYQLITDQRGGERLADVRAVQGGEDEAWANARLMAAAPDLLACCRAMLELHESGSWGAPPGEYLPALRAAIAKATGEASS